MTAREYIIGNKSTRWITLVNPIHMLVPSLDQSSLVI